MEHSLTYVVQEFENERSLIGNVARSELEQVRKVVDDLSTKLRTKTIEMRHIKRLAQHVLDQRTELELFFMESLEYVKQQIRQKRLGELRTNQENYKKSMKDVLKSRKVIPPLKSINPIKNSSLPTSLVIEPEEDSIPKKEKIDIQDLEWTDKEKILRVLFAKMNGISLTNEVEKRKPLIDELDRAHKHRSGFSDIVPSDSFSKKSYSRPGTSKSMQLSVVSELVSTVPPSTAGMNAEPEALSGSGFQPLTT
ncbi:hypothetical protein BC833DRAFT_169030 [Globomyces pollinis-pini]|nr:hypothetical protein BC833DRAFT_169030 [Globomyces pollinis-pini]